MASPSSLFSVDSDDDDANRPPSSPTSSSSSPQASPDDTGCPPPPPLAALDPPPIAGLHLLPSALPPTLASLLVGQIAGQDIFAGGRRDQAMLFGSAALAWADQALARVRSWGDALELADDAREAWDGCWESHGRGRQAILNLYPPGHGITPHVDLPHRYGEHILSVSLLSGTVFLLRRRRPRPCPPYPPSLVPPTTTTTASAAGRPPFQAVDAPAADDDADAWETHRFYLAQGSVLVLSGDARHAYEHGIEPLSFDYVERRRPADRGAAGAGREGDGPGEWRGRGTRVSLTLRWMRDGGDVVGGGSDDGDGDRVAAGL